ncbi:EAL domain-containing response regulator [Pseudomonas yamanorum]
MTSLRVLVLENHLSRDNAVVAALRELGVSDILQADSAEQAMALLNKEGGVDIALCDLGDHSLVWLEFLSCAGQLGLVQAVVLFCKLQPPLRRALDHVVNFSGLKLLGVLSPPMQTQALEKVLQRYSGTGLIVSTTGELPCVLPSEEDIRRGLDLGEFRAYYQPKFLLGSGEDAGAEVLARWQHPVRGLLLPKDFLAAVLAYDLIDEMFKQLFEQGLSLLSVLHRSNHSLGLAFNLSASQLHGNGLAEYIYSALERHGLPGEDLTFELAESGLLETKHSIQESLIRLRLMGCGLSIDDFGIGFFSLKSLCQLPFTQIKLNEEFVQTIHQPRSQAIISGALALACSLSMELLIEGVNNAQECQTLIDLGCHLGQGFHYAYPMTSHQLISWLNRN